LLAWLDLEAPDEAEIVLLREEFAFHPLAIEDAVRDHERPKVDTYPNYYLIACSLIAGIYGMNFAFMPELSWRYGYAFALGLMLAAGLGLGRYFRSRKCW
jgi:Mg2+ and Co2+ transporter CorA